MNTRGVYVIIIDEKKNAWHNIVTEIAIMYPFNEALKEVTVIDSPGINAAGMVGKVTETNLSKADALILVKSLSGQALESKAFKNFLSSSARERCKGALLLILTGKAGLQPEDADKLQNEAVKMYKTYIDEDHIAAVDSKLQLFRGICTKKDEEEIDQFLEKEGFDSAQIRWYKSKKDRSDFLNLMGRDAGFLAVNEMLEKFGRTAQNRQLSGLLELIADGYKHITDKLRAYP